MIRTSGEERLSNFLLWQCAYAEFLKMPSPKGEGGRGPARGRMRGEPAAAARQRVAPGNFALISHLR